MASLTEPAVVKEVILFKRSTLREVKSEIKDISTKIALLQLQDQDVSESNTQLQLLEPQELEFRRMKTTLDAALDRAVNLANSITWHTSMLSHIQLLPIELLSYIFFLTLDYTLFPEWTPSSFPPLIYARVCSSWHAAVLSTPQLWSSISIFIMPGRNWRNMLNLFLARSGTVPLSLEIIWHPKAGDACIAHVHDMLKNLVALSSSRWQRLQLFVPHDALEIILAQPLPALEYLGLGSEISELANPITSLNRSDFVPNLRTVSFLRSIRSSSPLAWDIPWSQLTEINSKNLCTSSEVLWLFHRCSSLERCRIRLSRYNHLDPGPEEVLVVMPHLEDVTFITSTGEDCLDIFHHLVLPCLKRVELRNASRVADDRGSLFPKQYLAPLVERSGCVLETLVLKDILVYEMELRDTVKCIPSLKSLEMSYREKDTVPQILKDLLLWRSHEDLRNAS